MAVSQLSAESCPTQRGAAPTRELGGNLASRRLGHCPRYGSLATDSVPPREPPLARAILPAPSHRIAMSRTGTGFPIQQARNERQ